jgi:predicted oxidoreductase
MSLPQPILTVSREGRMLGETGIPVSPLSWGMWRFHGIGVQQASALVHAALDAGISFFDTADIYGFTGASGFGDAETLLGQVFAHNPTLRGRMVLATKGGITPPTPYNSSKAYLIAACEASLRRLQTDHVELYQIHRPDTLAHPEEVAGALVTLREQGKIAHAGVSNYSAAQTSALQAFLPFRLASHQPEFSPLAIAPLGDGVLDQAMAQRMSVLAWSPLGGGRLGGAGDDTRTREVIAALDRIARRDNVPRTAVAYAWLMAHPAHPIPIVGSQQPDRIREALRAFDVQLTRDDWYAILTASRQAPLP